MKGNIFDVYSSLGFFQAMESKSAGGLVPGTSGETIDLRDAAGVAVVVNVGEIRFQSASALHLALQHGLASDAGVSAWSFVPASQLIHSVAGGYNSTSETGIFHSLLSDDSGSTAYAVGYKMDHSHRYLRLYVSGDAGVGSMAAGAVAILNKNDWPVNTPVN